MRPAACCRGSFLWDTSAKPGTNRIQSRGLQANANSHRHRSFQNSADSTAMSSLHQAFFTLGVQVTNLAVSNYWLLRLAMEWEVGAYTHNLAPQSVGSSLPDFVVSPQTFPAVSAILRRKAKQHIEWSLQALAWGISFERRQGSRRQKRRASPKCGLPSRNAPAS